MKCPCGGKLTTLDSRDAPLNTTRRVKQCSVCLRRFATYEYINKYPLQSSENRSPLMRKDMSIISKYFDS